jgi:hypothetical protein
VIRHTPDSHVPQVHAPLRGVRLCLQSCSDDMTFFTVFPARAEQERRAAVRHAARRQHRVPGGRARAAHEAGAPILAPPRTPHTTPCTLACCGRPHPRLLCMLTVMHVTAAKQQRRRRRRRRRLTLIVRRCLRSTSHRTCARRTSTPSWMRWLKTRAWRCSTSRTSSG